MPATVRSVIPLIGSGCRIRFSSNTETRFSGLFRLALRSQKNVRRFIYRPHVLVHVRRRSQQLAEVLHYGHRYGDPTSGGAKQVTTVGFAPIVAGRGHARDGGSPCDRFDTALFRENHHLRQFQAQVCSQHRRPDSAGDDHVGGLYAAFFRDNAANCAALAFDTPHRAGLQQRCSLRPRGPGDGRRRQARFNGRAVGLVQGAVPPAAEGSGQGRQSPCPSTCAPPPPVGPACLSAMPR